ncbi:hypothetical protein OG21DRAFT_1439498 [Imleria badia]|nr:hypothetical protein OG21DRAFT_1439498 [Imleria badia]
MHPERSSLSIRLTEPVVPLRNTPDCTTSRHRGGEMLPPAIVRGLLTLKLTKPTKVSSIELQLHAKASTRYAQGAGPSRVDVTEQYKVHSVSTVVFKAEPVPQKRRRATSTTPRVQFLDDHTGSRAQHGTRLNGVGSRHWQAPSDPHGVPRSASLDPQWSRRRLSSDELEIDYGTSPQRSPISNDPAPLYLPVDQHSFPDSNVAGRSQSVASSSRITEPQSSPSPFRRTWTPDNPHGSPASSVHSRRDIALSRTSSIEEVPEDDSDESVDTSAMRPGSVAYYGLSRIATSSSSRGSEQDHRGRSSSRFSFGKVAHIFEAVKGRVRSRSASAGSRPRSFDQEERGRSLTKGKGIAQVSTHGVRHAPPQIGVAELSVADGANDQSGDGWVVFPEGTYTYPVFFTIPNNSPPTMKADHGSLTWKVKVEVKRPGAFTSKMTAQKEVMVVCAPKDDDSEEVGGMIDLQRQWEGQLQYHVQITGRGVPVGGKIPFQITIMPLAKVKVHSILVYLDERTEYYTRAELRARSDVIRRATLLVIRHQNSDERHSKPILPLTSDEQDAFRNSPLYRFLKHGEDESEVASSFMGPGPWTIRNQLRVPDSCSILHPSNQNKGSNVTVNHTLKLVLRVEKEEGTVTTGRKKMYDIVIHIPIQILSCHCTSEWTSLPGYDEALQSEGDSPEDTSTCPCRTRREAQARTHSQATDTFTRPSERGTSPATSNSEALDTCPSDSLASRTHLHERLMSGLVSERGEAPPSYERFEAIYV